MSANNGGANRRDFLKSASALVAAACAPGTGADAPAAATSGTPGARHAPFNTTLLASLGATVLPASLGADGQTAAVAAFVKWCDGYDPVAEEMHGYGYADIRYLPADPVPAWHAQLDGLDRLAQRVHKKAFATLDLAQRQALVGMVTRDVRGDRLPAPLDASHVAVALLAHWASQPDAWNRALGVSVSPNSCRPLADAIRKPLPVAGPRA